MENAITANDANQTSEENFRTSEFLHVTPSPDRCGWWVDIDVEPLADAIREAMSLTDEDRRRMGAHGRELAARKYRWNIVAKQMSDVYRSLLESVRPSPRAVTAGDKSVDCGIQHAEN